MEEASFILGQLQSVAPARTTPRIRDRSPSPETEIHRRSNTTGSFRFPISRDEPFPPPRPGYSAIDFPRQHNVTDPSPEQGFTTALFGLEMSISEAKKLGYKIGLPDEHVRNITRPSTPHRLTSRTSPYLSNSEMGPPRTPEKRKASETIHQGRRTRLKSIDSTSTGSVLKATWDAPDEQNPRAPEEDATPSTLGLRHGTLHVLNINAYPRAEIVILKSNRCHT